MSIRSTVVEARLRPPVGEACPAWSNQWLPFLVPILAGTLLRVGWMIYNPHVIIYDEESYHQLATRLAQGQGYGLAIWPPGWPLTLALLYKVFGAHVGVGFWFNFVLSIATLALIGAIATTLFGRPAGIFSLWITALMPSYIVNNGTLMAEVWLQFLLVLTFWLACRPIWTWRLAISLGALTTLITLVRPFWLVLPPLLAVATRLHHDWRRPTRVVWLAQLIAVLLLVPWVVYISMAAGRFVPVGLNGGINLWIGNNPAATGTYVDPPSSYWNPANDQLAYRTALTWMVAHPLRVIALLPAKLWYLINVEPPVSLIWAKTRFVVAAEVATRFRWLQNISYWSVAAVATATVVRLVRGRRYALLLPLGLFMYNLASYLPFFGFARYRWPLQFLLIVYAAAWSAGGTGHTAR